MRTILAMLTSIGIVLHLQSSGSGLIPFFLQGWYKYPAVTRVTCPIGVSVPVTCSLPSVCVYRCPFLLGCVPAAGVPSGCPLSSSCYDVMHCPRCHRVASAAILLRPPDESWRVLSVPGWWHLAAALPAKTTRRVWEPGGWLPVAQVGCRRTEDRSAGGFSMSGNGFRQDGLCSCL